MALPPLPEPRADWSAWGSAVHDAVNGAATTQLLMSGDSIIYGQGVTDRATKSVAARTAVRLSTLLGTTVTAINAGVQADTTANMLAKLPALLNANHPRMVTLSATINDNKTTGTVDTVANLRKMIGLCRLAGAQPVIITNTPYDHVRYASASLDASTASARPGQVAAVRALATELRVPIADLEASLVAGLDWPTSYTVDGLHPNDAGADIWAQIIVAAIAAQPAPTNLGTPTYASDNFARTVASGLGSTAGGLGWTGRTVGGVPTSGWSVNGSQASGGVGAQTVDTGQANGTITVTLAAAGTVAQGVEIRRSASDDSALLLFRNGGTGNSYKLMKRAASGGTYTQVGATASVTPGTGDVVSVVLAGSSITVKINGTTAITATDATNQTATNHGLWANNTGALWDDFSHVP